MQWLPEAIEQLEHSVTFSPYDDYYCVRLGMAYTLCGRGEDAVAIIRRAIRLRPDNASYHCLLADAFAEMGFALRAAMHYDIAGELDPYDREYVARMRARNGRTDPNGDRPSPARSSLRGSMRCLRRRSSRG